MQGEQRCAVVTGAASGIGEATTRLLLKLGWDVIGADLNADRGERVLADLAEMGHAARFIFQRTDVSDEQQVAAAVDEARVRFGRLDLMVNNAGVVGAFGRITTIDVRDWDATFGVLARGVFLGTKHAARIMQGQDTGGAIVNIASVAGHAGGAGPIAYSAAKAAVLNFSRLAAVELAPFRIRVNTVSPGVIETPLLRHDVAALPSIVGTVQPWPEAGKPEDVAAVVAFLGGPESTFITGEDVRVDGALCAAGPRLTQVFADPAAKGLSGMSTGGTGAPPVLRPQPT